MDECKGIGMEHLAIGSVVGLRSESCILFAAVDAISNKGIAKVLKVNANLMGATRFQFDLNMSVMGETSCNAIMGNRALSALAQYRH